MGNAQWESSETKETVKKGQNVDITETERRNKGEQRMQMYKVPSRHLSFPRKF